MTAQPSSQAEREDVALLPCPFCGAAAIWREHDPARRPDGPFGLIVDHARDCFLRGVVNFDKASITGAWNTRPDREHATPRSMPEEVVEAYERAAKVCDGWQTDSAAEVAVAMGMNDEALYVARRTAEGLATVIRAIPGASA